MFIKYHYQKEVSEMTEEMCVSCGKTMLDNEGFISSTQLLVCSEECKNHVIESMPNHGESQLTVYSRVTGYYTPVKAWNRGKLQEFKDRRQYTMAEIK